MTACRDWLKTLWQASYKGVPFYVERDQEGGGRRIVVHEFPMRDDPFLEDLGEAKRTFKVTAYIVGAAADAAATAFSAVLASRGPGVLVLPTHGPLQARCTDFARERSKDKHGYIGFTLSFTRDAAKGAFLTTDFLAQSVFLAGAALGAAVAAAYGAALRVSGAPDYAVAAAVEGGRDALALVEAARVSEPLAPVGSATLRDLVQGLHDDLPTLVGRSGVAAATGTRLVEVVSTLGASLEGADAVRVLGAMIDDARPPGAAAAPATEGALAAALNRAAAEDALRRAALAALAEGLTRVAFADRRSGVTARADFAERAFAELATMAGAADAPVATALQTLAGAVADYLSALITTLAPVVTVEASLQLPSLFWSWRLYAVADRGTELVARNRVVHPSFMPNRFEALAR
jgi:prophage DNA circulation protein